MSPNNFVVTAPVSSTVTAAGFTIAFFQLAYLQHQVDLGLMSSSTKNKSFGWSILELSVPFGIGKVGRIGKTTEPLINVAIKTENMVGTARDFAEGIAP